MDKQEKSAKSYNIYLYSISILFHNIYQLFD